MKIIMVMMRTHYSSRSTKGKKISNVKPLNTQLNPGWPLPFLLSHNRADIPHLLSFLLLFPSTFFLTLCATHQTPLRAKKGKTDAVTERSCFLHQQKVFSRLWNKWSTRVESLKRSKKVLLMWWHVLYAGLKMSNINKGAKPVTWHVIIRENTRYKVHKVANLVHGGMLFIFLIYPWLQHNMS